jgi:hypothetical protein
MATTVSGREGVRGSSLYLTSTAHDRFLMESASAPEDFDNPRDLYPRVLVSDSEARDLCPPLHQGGRGGGGGSDHFDPRSDPGGGGGGGSIGGGAVDRNTTRTVTQRRKLDSTFRNDSLSSDQSECLQQQRPHPPKPHKSKRKLPSTTGMHQSGQAAATVASAAACNVARGVRQQHRRRGGSSFASSSEDEEIRDDDAIRQTNTFSFLFVTHQMNRF